MKKRRAAAAARALAAGAFLMILPAGARAETPQTEDEKYRRAIDAAVDAGLEYLARVQLPDGSFPGMPMCNAVAALSVMAFLAKGHTPGHPPYGDNINRAIDFVLSTQQPDGTLIGPGGGQMYSHNIACLMLSEVSGMVDAARQERIRTVLSRALQVTLAAQKVQKPEAHRGGWRYAPNSGDSDLSHSGWAMMALRSARNAGMPVPREAVDDAVAFIKRCACPDGGFAYQPGGGSGLARAGVGLLCLELSGEHRSEMAARTAAYILQRIRQGWGGEIFYYGSYYCAQGMFQYGGREWEECAPLIYDTLLKLQAPDGSWNPMPGSPHEDGPGPAYRTAVAILALGVTYQQLPIYQR